MGRVCADCGRDLPQTSYSSNQWWKGLGLSRCATCVHGHCSDTSSTQQSDGGRYNNSEYASFYQDALDYPFASGTFRWVAKGVYTDGPRSGQPCVRKWFKTGVVFEEEYFDLDLKAVERALELVNRFNESEIITKSVKINVPTVWEMLDFEPGSPSNQLALIEPFIKNYKKFNSNTGWKDDLGPWPQAMQALSHFSYHVSGGKEVLCDLQGGIYPHELVLSDPVILSSNGDYGVTDLGPDGISSFFSQHHCNQYCRVDWMRPASPRQHFKSVPGTTMIRRPVPKPEPGTTMIRPTVVKPEPGTTVVKPEPGTTVVKPEPGTIVVKPEPGTTVIRTVPKVPTAVPRSGDIPDNKNWY